MIKNLFALLTMGFLTSCATPELKQGVTGVERDPSVSNSPRSASLDIYDDPFDAATLDSIRDPLILDALKEVRRLQSVTQSVPRSIVKRWIFPKNQSEWQKMRGLSLLVMDCYVHRVEDFLPETLFVESGFQTRTRDHQAAPAAFQIPDLSVFRPMFYSKRRKEEFQNWGAYRQRRILLVPTALAFKKGEFQMRQGLKADYFPFEWTPLRFESTGVARSRSFLSKPWPGPLGEPDADTVTALLKRL